MPGRGDVRRAWLLALGAAAACAPAEDTALPVADPPAGEASAARIDAAPDTPVPAATPQGAVVAQPREPGTAPDSVARRMLVDVQSMDSTILVDIRYASADNFTGAPLPGYHANRALLREEAAAALARAQSRLRTDGFALKVWDGYRPARATRAMVEWAGQRGRAELLNGWIARRSRHNLGLAVDVTLVDVATGSELDMGTDFDTFTAAAHTARATGEVRRNRQRLVAALEREGFVNYAREWWHFDFQAPNPVRFDMPIR